MPGWASFHCCCIVVLTYKTKSEWVSTLTKRHQGANRAPAVDGHPEHIVTVTEELCGEKRASSPFNYVMGHIIHLLREDTLEPKGNSS